MKKISFNLADAAIRAGGRMALRGAQRVGQGIIRDPMGSITNAMNRSGTIASVGMVGSKVKDNLGSMIDTYRETHNPDAPMARAEALLKSGSFLDNVPVGDVGKGFAENLALSALVGAPTYAVSRAARGWNDPLEEAKARRDAAIASGLASGTAAISSAFNKKINNRYGFVSVPEGIGQIGSMALIRHNLDKALKDVSDMEKKKYSNEKKAEVESSTMRVGAMPDSLKNKKPPVPVKKTAGVFALKSRYPLNDYIQVKQAAAYFDKHCDEFTPDERREYCVNMVKRAEELNIPVSEESSRYASNFYAHEGYIKAAMDARRSLLKREDEKRLLNKLSSAWVGVRPDVFVQALSDFDKIAGIDIHYDRHIPDPYMSMLAPIKTASNSEHDMTVHVEGVNYIDTNKLLEFSSKKTFKELENVFGEDFAEEFKQDPIAIFKSMPPSEKKVIARMINDNSPKL